MRRFSCSRPHVICWQNSLLAGVRSVFVLVRPSTDQMRPAYNMDGNLLLLKVEIMKEQVLQRKRKKRKNLKLKRMKNL